MENLLPTGTTKLERTLETIATQNLRDIPVPIRRLWQVKDCPTPLLPWLGWSLSVDEWDTSWSDDQKRRSIGESFSIHLKKGTPGSVRRVLAAAGYGNVVITEGLGAEYYNADIQYNGDKNYSQSGTHWASYQIYLRRPISVSQAAQVRRILAQTVPARCHLAGLHYDEALHLYNHTLAYDGEFSHGVA